MKTTARCTPASPRRAAERRRAAAAPVPKPKRRLPRPDRAAWVFKSEDWLGRIGVGLLLFGLAFLFKYSVDQGWVGPGVRLAFGTALGAGLLGTGLRLYPSRRRYGQGLMGGGVAVWYATIFAAFELYGLLGYGLAFGLMVAVPRRRIGFAFEVGADGEVDVRWFPGNYSEYEEDRHERLGAAADIPKRIKYRQLTRG